MTGIAQRRDSFEVQFVKTTDGEFFLMLSEDATAEIELGPFPVEIVVLVERGQHGRADGAAAGSVR